MRLETERLILRPFEPRDRAPFAALNADPEVMRYFPSLRTAAQSDQLVDWIEQKHARDGFGFLAARLRRSGGFVGMIGLNTFDDDWRDGLPGRPRFEIGWRLARHHWGRGLVPEGARACLDYAWDVLELPEVVAITFRGNAASRRVMEKIGMVRDSARDFEHPAVAKGHELRDHVLYSISNPRPRPGTSA